MLDVMQVMTSLCSCLERVARHQILVDYTLTILLEECGVIDDSIFHYCLCLHI